MHFVLFDYQYYTVTYKGIGAPETIGQFKFGDEVSIDSSITGNVDAKLLASTQISLVKDIDGTIEDGEYKYIQDVNNRTTKVEAMFKMSVYENVVVELRYDTLYRVDFELF